MKTSRSFYKRTLIVTLALCAVIAVGVPIYRYSLPEPEQCALCELAYRCHAPALINLATGEILEMRVYEPNPIRPWELAEEQRTGYFRISNGAGLHGWCDGGIAAHAELREGVAMNDRLFCRRCRLLLTIAERRGYTILDLHDPECFRPYAIIKGQTYEINGYTISIEPGQKPVSLTVTTMGHLLDE